MKEYEGLPTQEEIEKEFGIELYQSPNIDSANKRYNIELTGKYKGANWMKEQAISLLEEKDKKIELYHNAIKNLEELVIEKSQGKDKNAVKFVQWANKNGWYKHNDPNDDCWTLNRDYAPIHDTKTTPELYSLYTQSKNK